MPPVHKRFQRRERNANYSPRDMHKIMFAIATKRGKKAILKRFYTGLGVNNRGGRWKSTLRLSGENLASSPGIDGVTFGQLESE